MATIETISFQGISTPQLGGYLALPEGDGPFPGVVVIHEIYGLTENIRSIARRFADAGYAALAVDLFADRNRTVCMFRFMGQMLFNPLKNGSIQDLKQSLTYLSNLPQVDSARIGAIGFCLGGGFAISWASTDDRLKAIAPFYGLNQLPSAAVERLCPVVGSYPDKDFTTKKAQKLDVDLDTYKIPHDIKIYPNTKHSFFNDQRANYDAAASADAWERVLAFFAERLTVPQS